MTVIQAGAGPGSSGNTREPGGMPAFWAILLKVLAMERSRGF
jgi:hypothetical protein